MNRSAVGHASASSYAMCTGQLRSWVGVPFPARVDMHTRPGCLENPGTSGTVPAVVEPLTELERRIDGLRTEVRRAALSGDPARARALRGDLRRAERDWDDALAAATPQAQDPAAARSAGPLLSIREQVHRTLTLLGVPSAPRLIVAVHGAFFAGAMVGTQLTSLRRDEERSFRSSPHARPFYLCGGLTADRLVPARGLLAVSTWPLAGRMVGPLSARVDFLTTAIRLAELLDRIGRPTLPASSMLWRFAVNIPGAAESFDAMAPALVADAARAELAIHYDADRAHREAAAARAGAQLDEVQQLFGSALKVVRGAAATT